MLHINNQQYYIPYFEISFAIEPFLKLQKNWEEILWLNVSRIDWLETALEPNASVCNTYLSQMCQAVN